MAKEKFNWKSLFINDENGDNNVKKAPQESGKASFPSETSDNTKFPEQHIKQAPSSTIMSSEVSNSTLDSIVEMYQSGFDSLNLPGYDFYEFFKAIKAVNSNDPAVYKMAMTMAQSVDLKVSKASLLEGSDFYIAEINKVHKHYAEKGNAKREEIQSNQRNEKEKLTAEISELEKQIITLQTKVSDKKIKLETADSSLLNQVAAIDEKIVANDMAKNKILETIVTVVNDIKTNL